MFKYKNLVVGFGVGIITTVMWLVSACTQLVSSTVPNQAPKVVNSSVTNSTTTTEPSTLSKATTIITTPATTQSSAVTTSAPTLTPTTPSESATTTTKPPTIDNSTQTTTTTPFYDVDINSYTLTINGAVNASLSLSYAQILAYPPTTQTGRIICPGEEDETDQWTGVPLSTILNAAGVLPGATEVVITGLDGYYTQLPLATVMDSSAFLAYQIDGQNLTWERGYPLRLILSKSFVGANMPRWISSIEVKSSLASYSNPSATIQNARSNIPTSGSKLCSCFLSATVANYKVVQEADSISDQSDSRSSQEKV
jgi:DMSO/TMAO reductase YedYZ molybdopterin-dependent catalytic subunit